MLKYDEKHILYKISKHHGERRGVVPYNPDNVLNQLPAITPTDTTTTTPTPPINPKALATLKTSRNRHELRQHTLGATTRVTKPTFVAAHERVKNFISRLAHQTEVAWTRSELGKIELGDIRAGKQGRKKFVTVVIADGPRSSRTVSTFATFYPLNQDHLPLLPKLNRYHRHHSPQ